MNAKAPTARPAVKDAEKDASMQKQKAMMASHYDRLTAAHQGIDETPL